MAGDKFWTHSSSWCDQSQYWIHMYISWIETDVLLRYRCTKRSWCCCCTDRAVDLGVVSVWTITTVVCHRDIASPTSTQQYTIPSSLRNVPPKQYVFLFKSEQLALYSFLYTYLHVPLWQGLAFWIWIFVFLYPSCIYVPYIWGLNLDRNIHPVAVLKICLYILHSIYVVGPCWLIKHKQCYTSHCPQACEIWPIALTSVWSVWLIDRFNK